MSGSSVKGWSTTCCSSGCLDLNIMDRGFDHSVFAKNRQRLLDADMAREFLL